MRKFIQLSLVLFCSLNAFPQWGVKGGLNYSTLSHSTMCKYTFGGHIGGTYDLRLSNNWYLQPGLLFTSIGCKLDDDGSFLKGKYINIYALELPVNFSARPRLTKNTKMLIDRSKYFIKFL